MNRLVIILLFLAIYSCSSPPQTAATTDFFSNYHWPAARVDTAKLRLIATQFPNNIPLHRLKKRIHWEKRTRSISFLLSNDTITKYIWSANNVGFEAYLKQNQLLCVIMHTGIDQTQLVFNTDPELFSLVKELTYCNGFGSNQCAPLNTKFIQ